MYRAIRQIALLTKNGKIINNHFSINRFIDYGLYNTFPERLGKSLYILLNVFTNSGLQ
jgi:hypothetical protein